MKNTQKGFVSIILSILGVLVIAGIGYTLIHKKSSIEVDTQIKITGDTASTKVISPNGGESFLTTDTVSIKYQLPAMNSGEVAELYLLDSNNKLSGFIGNASANGLFSWSPKDLKHNGGLDNSVSAPLSGEYKVLLLVRAPSKQSGSMEKTVINIDGTTSLVNGGIFINTLSKPMEGIKASDTSDNSFTITNWISTI